MIEFIPDYFITENGKVWSSKTDKFLKTYKLNGYELIKIQKVQYRVHRLVANAYIANPKHLPIVNHKDGNRSNNSKDNLEWCTHIENYIHSCERQRNGLCPIIQLTRGGEFITSYHSIQEACRKTGCYPSNITKVLNGRRKTCRGYVWRRGALNVI